jgi:hypothetical protein
MAEDRYSLVVSTRPLLRNVPDPGKAPIRGMSLKDLKSTRMFVQSAKSINLTLVDRYRYVAEPYEDARTRRTELEPCRGG